MLQIYSNDDACKEPFGIPFEIFDGLRLSFIDRFTNRLSSLHGAATQAKLVAFQRSAHGIDILSYFHVQMLLQFPNRKAKTLKSFTFFQLKYIVS